MAIAGRAAQMFEEFPQRHVALALTRFVGQTALHVGGRQAIKLRLEFRRHRLRLSKRVEMRHHVTAHAMIADQLVDTIL